MKKRGFNLDKALMIPLVLEASLGKSNYFPSGELCLFDTLVYNTYIKNLGVLLTGISLGLHFKLLY